VMLNPSRIEFARTRRRWTKTRLAQELGVQSRAIQAYESGEYEPEPDRLMHMAMLLRFPVSFFSGEDLPIISEHTASFRSMSKMSGALKGSALNAGSLAFVLNHWIESRFRLPTAQLPDLSDLSPEDAAATLRRMWGLGQAPISNVIHLLESKGVRVYSLAIEAREVDAFSVWHEGTPFVFLNTFKSAEHSRFDAGHELGHLVRDRHSMLHGKAHSPEMEREANAFASAFLMPRDDVVARRPSLVTMPQLIELKSYWGVSLAALAYRMNSLRLVTEWTYRTLCIDIAKKGYRTKEPKPMRQETSQMLPKVFDTLRNEGVKKADIAAELCLALDDLNALTFMLTLSGIPAQEDATLAVVQPSRSANLRLVR
jgi:Zn-dependent peptidase ImmA (M78 family)/transcriptional regulator with XRE-family HTH domain